MGQILSEPIVDKVRCTLWRAPLGMHAFGVVAISSGPNTNMRICFPIRLVSSGWDCDIFLSSNSALPKMKMKMWHFAFLTCKAGESLWKTPTRLS